MKPWNGKQARVWIFLAVFWGWSVNAGGGDSLENVSHQLEQEKKELQQLKSRIEKQERTIQVAGSKETSVLKTLRRIEDRLKLKERELRIYDWNKKVNRKKIAQLEDSIQATENKLDRQKEVLGQRLRTIYKEGEMFPIKVLFSAVDFNDLLQRIKYMEIVTEYDSSLFRKYEDDLNRLETEKEALLGARRKLIRLEKAARTKQKEIQEDKKGKAQFLKKLKEEKALSIQVRKELVAASKNLNQLIARLQEKLVQGEGLDIIDKKGRLKLPVQGPFLNKFGKKRGKRYHTYVIYNGVNIEASRGTPVRAIFQGKVLYTGWLEGYGNLIILGHGKEYHSLYGHLDEIITKVGRVVRTGQIIGRSGDTGSLMGETLYFELRHEGQPIEPTSWFALAQRQG